MKKKIMIIDDNKDFLDELQETLSLSGYDVVTVDNSVIASEVAAKTKPDIVLLDLKMEGKTGFKVADEIKHSSQLRNVPIIAMTGYFTNLEYSLLINLCGIKKCLIKPFNPLDVIAQIENLLQDEGRSNS